MSVAAATSAPALQLHDYQQVAVEFLHRNNRAGLLLDMGLGKTAAALTALTPDHLPALVIAPKRVAKNVWPAETRKWRPDLSVSLAAGRRDDRRRGFRAGADVTVLGRDNLSDVGRHHYKTVILDEMSSFKNRGSDRSRRARQITKGVPHVWGLTGTPTPNGYLDLWSQMLLLDGGARLGTKITAYRDRYFTPARTLPNGIVSLWAMKPGAEAAILSLIEDICLSMKTDGRIDLPPVTHNEIVVDLPDTARRAYRDLKAQYLTDLRDLIGGEVHTAANAAVLSSKLSQVTAGFVYVDDADLRDYSWTSLHTEKIKAVVEVVEGTGSPVLVFYRFKAELEMLRAALPDAVEVREPGAIDAWNEGTVPVLLAHPASAGHGLNLQHGGHTAVWTSLPWSSEDFEQANKRLARQGQRHPVVIHRIMAKRTVDQLVYDRLTKKITSQDALLAHLESLI